MTFKKKIIFVMVSAFLIWFVLANASALSKKETAPTPTPTAQVIATPTAQVDETITYEGKKGKDALTLLKEQATVEQAASGLVNSINGRKADDGKHEYWAFYVNGELAQVGPADYKTKDGDTIVWKIEKY